MTFLSFGDILYLVKVGLFVTVCFPHSQTNKLYWKERIASAIREFELDKYTSTHPKSLPSAEELRAALAASGSSSAREAIAALYDADTFVETGAYVKRGFAEYLADDKTSALESVITGYGAVDGKLVFTYAFDFTRNKGAVDEKTAAKIVSLYETATKNGAPVVAILDSAGADVFEGVSALAAYARILRAAAAASGVVPQFAYVIGKCSGTLATLSAMCDAVLLADGAELYVTAPSLTAKENAQKALLTYSGDKASCAGYLRALISFLPSCADLGVSVSAPTDDLNRMLGNVTFGKSAEVAVSAIADGGFFLPASKTASILCAYATIGGVKCGVVASDATETDGKLDAKSARVAARFVDLCDAWSLPIVTLVDSKGIDASGESEESFAAELAKLAFAYAGASVPKITVVLGNAIGASFILLGSRALGADVVYALDSAEIGALAAEAGVAFAWEKHISGDKSREELAAEWKASVASPVAAAETGEIDDIISISELRCRIASAALMLSAKGTVAPSHRAVRPL